MKIRLEWQPRDLWIGAYWAIKKEHGVYTMGTPGDRETVAVRQDYLHVWVCLFPCLPVHFKVFLREVIQ